ncbi:saccharopine dehydrogenase NADP-binding domain-containing protein [Angustibacter aerolatus]
MDEQIWVLGATGRSGRGIARRLHETGHHVVLVGRDGDRLADLTAGLSGAEVVAAPFDEQLARLHRAAPRVVVSTVGPFARTAAQVVAALPPGTHYLDLGNELSGTQAVLDQHERALADGSTLVTGAGFGVVATETAALLVAAGRRPPARVRVDAIASLASPGGVVGEALAGIILDGAPDGGRRVHGGRLVRAAVAGDRQRFSTPSGDTVTTSALPSGELLAAWRATGAPEVVAATSALPASPLLRAAFPALGVALRSNPLRELAVRRLARLPLPERERPSEFSWGRARAEWDDGSTREVWLRLGDAQAFTSAVAAEVARRLSAGAAAPGSYTPGALLGTALATGLGADVVEVH